jgi:hypothetical protein
MGGKSNYLRNGYLDWLLRGQSFTPPATTYVALFTSPPNAAGGGIEVAGPVEVTGYQRFAVASTLAMWRPTQGDGSANPSTGTSGRISNAIPIQFNPPNTPWNDITNWALMNHQSLSAPENFLLIGQLALPYSVTAGGSAVIFPIDSLAVYEV